VDNSEEPLISIVVPIHKMAGRLFNLERVLKDARSGNLPIEFVLVHDGHDIGTSNELEIFSEKYRVSVVQGDFNSPGLAKNYGMEYTKANWVAFWDSDDIGNPIALTEAVSKVNSRTKILIGGYRTHLISNDQVSKIFMPSRKLDKLMVNPGCWRFVFRKEVIGETKFPKMKMGEDQVFLAKLRIDESQVTFIDDCFYTYFIGNMNQLTNNASSVAEVLEATKETGEFIQNSYEVKKYIYVINARLILSALKNGQISFAGFLSLLFKPRVSGIRKKLEWILGFVTVLTNIVARGRT
jgi:glycosyltransferase involved in cell wall biosynthesis